VSNKAGANPADAAAARALAAGDPLGALNAVGPRDDASARALRGLALAQLGDLARARTLLRSAARAFGPRAAVARARCVVAEAEIALVSRDLGWPAKSLAAARATLARHGDRANAAHAECLEVRRLVLVGKLDEAARALAGLDAGALSPASRVGYELVAAGLAVRRLVTSDARASLARAERHARRAGIPALAAEVERAALVLEAPAARRIAAGEAQVVRLSDVEALFASGALVVDACRRTVRRGSARISLARRPVLFALARILGEAWPRDVTRDGLVARVFGARRADESHRARLRVEAGRLRAALRTLAGVEATPGGFVLAPRRAREVVVLAPPVEGEHAGVLALLADGEAWSSSALALALGVSARTVQRALDALAATDQVRSVGRGRTQRWMAPPPPGITTALLLPAPPAAD